MTPLDDQPLDDLPAAIQQLVQGQTAAVQQLFNDQTAGVQHIVDMAWRKGCRDGLEMAAQMVDGLLAALGYPEPAFVALRDGIRLASHNVPTASEQPTT